MGRLQWSVSFTKYELVIYQIKVVPLASAIVPGAANAEALAIPGDHLSMVKFGSREDGGYQTVSGHLQLLAQEAPNVIRARWEEQDLTQNGMTPIRP